MGDYFQTLADIHAAPEDADRLAADIRDWLIASGVISPDRTDCVLGAPTGHPPGPRVNDVVDGTDDSWRDLWSNGLDIKTGQTVFDAGQGEPWAVTCPHCTTEYTLVSETFELVLEAWEPFRDVVHGWDEGDKVVKTCPTCERPVDPQAWQWADDYFALGHLGFTFWNWPPLRPDFIAALAARLGHPPVHLEGKL
ncbi:hypothetical protein [Actinomadura geliboluensis]|uniref:hypothetical protein n=1 Tax=Actinomadura geliboluensis TaxID=882440 RepID=UPI0026220996|nr:hypothetical protein [Actinomadura geliboluensis]